jgi:hypothetical protein
LLNDYATTYRRERSPLPQRLSELRRSRSQPNGDNAERQERIPTERELV